MGGRARFASVASYDSLLHKGRLSTVDLVPDEGEQLPSREAALNLAKEMARDLSRNRQPSYIRGKSVVVTDKAGTEVFRTPLSKK
jgi:hypothetical protein